MKVIEFLGMPRAGKTTQIGLLKKFLETRGKKIAIITDRERAERVHVRPIESLGYILTFFSLALDEYFQCSADYDYLLIDNGFNDAVVWADTRLLLQEISQAENEAFKICFEKFRRLVDVPIIFDLPIEAALQRHVNSGDEQDVDKSAINKRWLECIRIAYQQNESSFHNSLHVDGSKATEIIEIEIRQFLGLTD